MSFLVQSGNAEEDFLILRICTTAHRMVSRRLQSLSLYIINSAYD